MSSGLLWASFYPVAAGWLAWIALVPWLMLVRAGTPNWIRYSVAWLAGLAFFVPALSWMRVAHETMFYSWLGLALYCSWYFPLGMWLLRRLDRRTRVPLTVSVPLVWVALEFLRGSAMGGFAWYFLGHAQHAFLPVIQISDLAGVAGVSFLVAAVNGLCAEAISARIEVRRALAFSLPSSSRLRPQIVGVSVLIVAAMLYGGWQLRRSEFAPGPTVALLQSNIPQGIRNERDVEGDRGAAAEDNMMTITRRLVAEALRGTRPDLLVWPETTFPIDWKEAEPGGENSPQRALWTSDIPAVHAAVTGVADDAGTSALLGLNTLIVAADGSTRRYNSALLVTPGAKTAQGRYDKMHLVPFGEYVPLRETIPWLKKLAPYDYDFSLAFGNQPTRFRLKALDGREYTFGALICYEDSDAPLARLYACPADGPPVDFLVNLSNDGWFMGTGEHEEHLAVSRFRAVECRRSLVRAVNMGISAVIDSNGRVVALPRDTWSASKGVEAVVRGVIPIDQRASLYAMLGDWLPWACWVGVAIGCVIRRRPVDGRG